jgi:Ricin-type beta-trefoil lectin domain
MDAKTMRTRSGQMMLIAASVAAPWMVAYGEAPDNVKPLESSLSAEASQTAPAANDEAVPLALFHLDWLGTGNCLDSNASGQVYTNPCQSDNNFQKWSEWYRIGRTGTIHIHLRDFATGRCLGSNAARQVYTNPCQSNNNFQTWITRAADIGGLVRFKNLATQLCLQLSTNGNVVTGDCNRPNGRDFWVKEP